MDRAVVDLVSGLGSGGAAPAKTGLIGFEKRRFWGVLNYDVVLKVRGPLSITLGRSQRVAQVVPRGQHPLSSRSGRRTTCIVDERGTNAVSCHEDS